MSAYGRLQSVVTTADRKALVAVGCSVESDFCLLRDLKGIIDFDPKISHRALELSMPKKQLNRSKIFRSTVDERRFRPPHRMCSVSRGVQTDRFQPPDNDARVLAGRQVWRVMDSAREQVLASGQLLPVDPGKHRLPGLLRNFELNGPAGLALHNYRTVKDASALRDVVDAQTDQITAAQLAIDSKVEQGKVAKTLSQL
jgi:hypothetical protein